MNFILITFLLVHFPQLGYELSQSTLTSFQDLVEINDAYHDEILSEPIFRQLISSKENEGTLSLKITEQHWDGFKAKVAKLPNHLHAEIAKKCRQYSFSPDISQTSSDRKFWHNLYNIHLSLAN